MLRYCLHLSQMNIFYARFESYSLAEEVQKAQ